MYRKKTSTKIVRSIAKPTSTEEYCPAPRMIGMGPMSITAPLLTLLGLRLESEPKVINKIPMKIIAKAIKNSHEGAENCDKGEMLGTVDGPSLV